MSNISLEEITPEKAAEYLGVNFQNRNIRPKIVSLYAKDMHNGEWRASVATPICFSESGDLIDGQHRLAAIIDSGKTIQMVVVRGLAKGDQLVIDTGIRRSFADHLKMRGEHNVTQLAAILRAVSLYEMQGNLSSNRISHPTMLDTLERYPTLRDVVSPVWRINQEVGMGYNAGGLTWWLFDQINHDDCATFFDQLVSGAGLEEGNPILTLRKVFLADIRGRRNFNLTPNFKAAITIKAWNKWRQGDSLQQLRWLGGGNNAEPFPVAM